MRNAHIMIAILCCCCSSSAEEPPTDPSTSTTLVFEEGNSEDDGGVEGDEYGSGEGMSEGGTIFDLEPPADQPPGFCGDGVVNQSEDCDTALPLVEPCPGDIGNKVCQADCLWNYDYCGCSPGDAGCLCDNGQCSDGLECVNGQCSSVCLNQGQECGALTVCCAGLSCTENAAEVGLWTCS